MARLLLHMCCAHCGAYTAEHWRKLGHAVTIYWYNPNIHPYREHQLRREAVRLLARSLGLPVVEHPEYGVASYFRAVSGRETAAERCPECFHLRLAQTARFARANSFDAFTSTLLISPQQRHEAIRVAGLQCTADAGVPFLYADIRKRYSDSRRLSKPLGLYRQEYCGCLFSEWERLREAEIKESGGLPGAALV